MPTLSPWPIPERGGLGWKIGGAVIRIPTLFVPGTLLRLTQRIQTKNVERFCKAVWERPKGMPLVTVSNHTSYIDDPGFLRVLPLRSVLSERTLRWVPGAQEICFKNRLLSFYFSRCQVVPVTRGDGVYQRGVDFCINKLNEGKWVHFYPEGKMNMTGESLRYKWGVGRVIAESKKVPLVLPLWHVGMEDILPTKPPFIPRLFKKLTVLVGEPIDFTALLQQHRKVQASAVVVRKQITDVLQEKMEELRNCAEQLHHSWDCNSLVASRSL